MTLQTGEDADGSQPSDGLPKRVTEASGSFVLALGV